MLLGVNIDHVATVRNARGGFEPDVYQAAYLSCKCGANSITMHLREDRRHINEEDLKKISTINDIKLNLEMAATDEMQKIALQIKPHSCCIVPEKRQEITTEDGLDIASQLEYISDFIKPLLKANIIVALFINPDNEQILAAKNSGVEIVELHAGAYAKAFGTENEEAEFQKLNSAADYAHSLGLTVKIGHGLTYKNVMRMHEIKNIYELDIGHTIIAKAIFAGLEPAIIEMKRLVA